MKMKKLLMAGILGAAVTFAGCGKQEEEIPVSEVTLNPVEDTIDIQTADVTEAPVETAPEEPVNTDPEGMVRSELTNEWIDEALADQRPIAVMVDNESIALPHYGVSDADIVYEMMNSTLNGRITRFMVILKDWEKIEQLGSIRSARPTNVILAGEYNAILIHDGGPFYIDDYIKKPYTNNLSGGFARYSNGKGSEFTEYVTYDQYYNPTTGNSYRGLRDWLEYTGYSTTYNDYYRGRHFLFPENGESVDLTSQPSVVGTARDVTTIDLSGVFPHNRSQLKYNTSTGTYDYYEYGDAHLDPGNDNAPLSFENVILQKCTFTQLDPNGYLIYNILSATPMEGWLIQDGKAVEIQWIKTGEEYPTVFTYAKSGVQVVLNTGKTYVGIVPADSWGSLSLE